MKKRFFSLDEARALLPEVCKITSKMLQLAAGLEQFQDDARELAALSAVGAGGPAGTAYVESIVALQLCVRQLSDAGCLVKGVREGLIDFPHLSKGREVYLCWKHGEDDIHYWHEVEAGFAGRRPLSELS